MTQNERRENAGIWTGILLLFSPFITMLIIFIFKLFKII